MAFPNDLPNWIAPPQCDGRCSFSRNPGIAILKHAPRPGRRPPRTGLSQRRITRVQNVVTVIESITTAESVREKHRIVPRRGG